MKNRRKSKATRGKGTEKVGTHCPAAINVQYINDGEVEVNAFLSHFGHDKDICYITLSATIREKVKQKLKEGFAPDEIANFV